MGIVSGCSPPARPWKGLPDGGECEGAARHTKRVGKWLRTNNRCGAWLKGRGLPRGGRVHDPARLRTISEAPRRGLGCARIVDGSEAKELTGRGEQEHRRCRVPEGARERLVLYTPCWNCDRACLSGCARVPHHALPASGNEGSSTSAAEKELSNTQLLNVGSGNYTGGNLARPHAVCPRLPRPSPEGTVGVGRGPGLRERSRAVSGGPL